MDVNSDRYMELVRASEQASDYINEGGLILSELQRELHDCDSDLLPLAVECMSVMNEAGQRVTTITAAAPPGVEAALNATDEMIHTAGEVLRQVTDDLLDMLEEAPTQRARSLNAIAYSYYLLALACTVEYVAVRRPSERDTLEALEQMFESGEYATHPLGDGA